MEEGPDRSRFCEDLDYRLAADTMRQMRAEIGEAMGQMSVEAAADICQWFAPHNRCDHRGKELHAQNCR